MANNAPWQSIVASALDWEQAHASLEHAIEGLAPELRGRRPDAFPHSAWELLEHIRITQLDLLEFCRNANYQELKWPDQYWPDTPAPRADKDWDECVAGIRRDRDAFKRFTEEPGRDLTAKIPHRTGQTYLRTVLVAVDHTSYHVGQIIAVRRLLGAWPGK
jgi:uncharacterized damage-inducible protein DinB